MGGTVTPLVIPGAPGGPEVLLIVAIAILLSGTSKLPKLARSTGEAMGEFHKGKVKTEQELQEMREQKTSPEIRTPTPQNSIRAQRVERRFSNYREHFPRQFMVESTSAPVSIV